MSPLREGGQDVYMGAGDGYLDEDFRPYLLHPSETSAQAHHHDPTARPSKSKSHKDKSKSSEKEKSGHRTSPSSRSSSSSTSKTKDNGKVSSGGEKKIPCVACEKTFEHQHKLNKHMATHELPYRCPLEYCTTAKASNKEISRHVWASHKEWAGQTSYPPIHASCKRCGQTFTRADNLKQHQDEGRCKGSVEESRGV